MRLKTVTSNFGKTIGIFDGIQITFDNSGFCEVKDAVGKKMLESYPSFIFSEEFEATPPKTRTQEYQQGAAEQLQRELDFVNETLKSREGEIANLKADRDAWADKVAEVEANKVAALEELDNYKKTYENQIKFYELKINLVTSTNEKLKKMCELSEFPKEEWDKMNKEQIVEYILSKS